MYHFISLPKYIVILESDEPVITFSGEHPPHCVDEKRPPLPQKLFVFQDYYNWFDHFAGKITSVSAVGTLVNTSTDIFLHFVVCSL